MLVKVARKRDGKRLVRLGCHKGNVLFDQIDVLPLEAGDVAKPLKMLLPDYRVIEERIEAAVFARFGLPAKLPQCVKDADRVLLRTEQRDLMGADGHQWSFTDGTAPLDERIEPLPPSEAKWLFLTRYASLRPNSEVQDAP